MVKLYEGGAYLVHGTHLVPEKEAEKVAALTGKKADKEEARKGTMAYSIPVSYTHLQARDVADPCYTGNFDETWNDVVEGCAGFLEFLKARGEV